VQSLEHHNEPSRHHCSVSRDEPIRRQLAIHARRIPRLPGSSRSECGHRARADYDALGHATGATCRGFSRHQHPHHHVGSLARLVKPESRCLVRANSFANMRRSRTRRPRRRDVVWFALNNDRPLFAFGGLWTEFEGRIRTPICGRSNFQPQWLQHSITSDRRSFTWPEGRSATRAR
jgi:hypothetical protein